MNDLDIEIKDELLKDKISRIYKSYKKTFNFLFFLIVFFPILFQVFFYYKDKQNEKYFSNYLQAEILIDNSKTEGVNILKNLLNVNNQTIVLLSLNKLLDYYLSINKTTEALELINSNKIRIGDNSLNELLNIKKILLNFNNIKEEEILKLLKNKNQNYFKIVKKKLLKDFYMKNKQYKKANQIQNKDL